VRRTPPVFDPAFQHGDVDSKIVAATERIGQAFRVLLWREAKKHGLSPLQVQLLVYCLYHPGEHRQVTHLARDFSVTKPTISDPIATLEAKGLVAREPSAADGRVVALSLTPSGKRLALGLARWADTGREALAALPPDDRAALAGALTRWIESLQRAGVVTVARLCVTCRFFERRHARTHGFPYYCRLLEKPLVETELRVDCLEHVPA
jgi:DNA-binding MarR family transcriptional regulator